ncbi:MAG: hypothetical protein V3T17_02490, partial [Pseudomonadales bacterium]
PAPLSIGWNPTPFSGPCIANSYSGDTWILHSLATLGSLTLTRAWGSNRVRVVTTEGGGGILPSQAVNSAALKSVPLGLDIYNYYLILQEVEI